MRGREGMRAGFNKKGIWLRGLEVGQDAAGRLTAGECHGGFRNKSGRSNCAVNQQLDLRREPLGFKYMRQRKTSSESDATSCRE